MENSNMSEVSVQSILDGIGACIRYLDQSEIVSADTDRARVWVSQLKLELLEVADKVDRLQQASTPPLVETSIAASEEVKAPDGNKRSGELASTTNLAGDVDQARKLHELLSNGEGVQAPNLEVLSLGQLSTLGFYDNEAVTSASYRWAGLGAAKIEVPINVDGGTWIGIVGRFLKSKQMLPKDISLRLDEKEQNFFMFTDETHFALWSKFDAKGKKACSVTLQASVAHTPLELGLGQDERRLSFCVTSIAIAPAGEPIEAKAT